MSAPGKALELAIMRGDLHYRQEGRKVALIRQHAPMIQGANGMMYSDVGAPVDFIGGVDGQPWGLEYETTKGDYLPLKAERRAQRSALRTLHECGFHVALVIDFTDYIEVYAVPWQAIDAFELKPWRRSLSLDFARAYGLLLPETRRDTERYRRTLFLDGAPHRDHAAAHERVDLERASTRVVSSELLLAQDDKRDERWAERRASKAAETETMAQLLARKPPSDGDQAAYIRWLDEFSRRMHDGDTARARKAQRGKPGPWRGGNRNG